MTKSTGKRHATTEQIEFRVEETKKLFKAGYSDAGIAATLGVGIEAVRHYRRKLGLKKKRNTLNYSADVGVGPDGRLKGAMPAASTLIAKTRKCLKCGNKFKSQWAGHRACDSCRKSRTWRSGGDFSVGARI